MIWSVKEYLWALSRCHWLLLSAYNPFSPVSLTRAFSPSIECVCVYFLQYHLVFATFLVISFISLLLACSFHLFFLYHSVRCMGVYLCSFVLLHFLWKGWKNWKRFHFEAFCVMIIRFVVPSDVFFLSVNMLYLFISFGSRFWCCLISMFFFPPDLTIPVSLFAYATNGEWKSERGTEIDSKCNGNRHCRANEAAVENCRIFITVIDMMAGVYFFLFFFRWNQVRFHSFTHSPYVCCTLYN